MPYSQDQQNPIPTFAAALEAETVTELKALAALASTEQPRPIRKAELVNYILRHTEGDKLKALWRRLDTLPQVAIAETVYGQDGYFRSGSVLDMDIKINNLLIIKCFMRSISTSEALPSLGSVFSQIR